MSKELRLLGAMLIATGCLALGACSSSEEEASAEEGTQTRCSDCAEGDIKCMDMCL